MAATPQLTLKTGDTYPPVLGSASKKSGLLNLSTADELLVHIKSGGTLISGKAEAIQPPTEDEEGVLRNWEYPWAEGDTNIAGEYQAELHVIWDSDSSPPQREVFPSNGTVVVLIEAAQ